MYRIPHKHSRSTGKKLEDMYYDKFVQLFRSAIQRKRTKRTWTIGCMGHRGKKIKLYLEPGSKADQFLEACISKDDFMRKLLTGGFAQLVEIYKEIGKWVGDASQMKPLTEAEFLDIYTKQQAKQLDPVCIFLYAIRHVFIDTLYEGVLDKAWITKRLGLKYCPYCGDENTSITEFEHAENGKTIIKPELDHFLPKSIYPFFAVSFFNLIPSGGVCNDKRLKGTYDPLLWNLDGSYEIRLMNPYCFDDKELTFSYIPQTEKEELQVKCIIPNTLLDGGYNHVLGIESRYNNHKDEVFDMQERMNNYLEMSIICYGRDTYKFEQEFLRKYPSMVLGFDLSKYKPWEKSRYKFLKDIFMQMSYEYGVKP